MTALKKIESIEMENPIKIDIHQIPALLMTNDFIISDVSKSLNQFFPTLQLIPGNSFDKLLDPAWKSEKNNGLKFQSQEAFTCELKFISQTTKEVWANAQFVPTDNGYLVFISDISEVKAELKVRTDIMNLTSIVSEGDLKGNILFANEKYSEVSQYSREELLGQPHNLTRHPDMPKEVFKEMWKTIGKGNIFRGIVKNRAKDGTPYYVDAVIAPIIGSNGKPQKYLGVRYDITNLETERHNMRAVLNAIDATLCYMEYSNDGLLYKVNDRYLQMMGIKSSESVISKNYQWIFPDFIKVAGTHAWNQILDGNSWSGLLSCKSGANDTVWLQTVIAPVTDEMGRVIKVILLASDVTKQQQMLLSIQEASSALSAASAELTATASQMASTAEHTSQNSKNAQIKSEEVASGVQMVATNIEEMVASIREISKNTMESSALAKSTMALAEKSNVSVSKLGHSGLEIGDVIKVISAIAQQTNLLALNATIEAARAGDAGRGFAVVASEVKELAKQTAKATEDITKRIGAIQSDTQLAIDAITAISQSIEKLNSFSTMIAAAVEEQTATTSEISKVVVTSKMNVESMNTNIKSVYQSANESNINSNQTLEASKELSILAEKLKNLALSATP